MKILVTGANGYVGQGVVKQLLMDGIEVVATDLQINNIDTRADVIQADLFTVKDPYVFFGRPDVLLHLAWEKGFVHNDIAHIQKLPCHYVFIKKLVESGIKKICGMGSMHEIGFYEGCISAKTPTNPLSLYGISKDALRRSLEILTSEKEIAFQWIRGYYIVGNSEYGSSIFSKISSAEKKGEKTFPFTQGQNQWDFIDYEYFCKEVAAIVEQDQYQGIINACSGYPEKLADRVERFIREKEYRIRLDYGVFPDRPYDSKAVWGDDTIIKKIMKNHEENASKN